MEPSGSLSFGAGLQSPAAALEATHPDQRCTQKRRAVRDSAAAGWEGSQSSPSAARYERRDSGMLLFLSKNRGGYHWDLLRTATSSLVQFTLDSRFPPKERRWRRWAQRICLKPGSGE